MQKKEGLHKDVTSRKFRRMNRKYFYSDGKMRSTAGQNSSDVNLSSDQYYELFYVRKKEAAFTEYVITCMILQIRNKRPKENV